VGHEREFFIQTMQEKHIPHDTPQQLSFVVQLGLVMGVYHGTTEGMVKSTPKM